MKLSDTASGILAATLGLAIIGYSTTFPPMPGQSVGPGLFPTIIGCGLVVFGLALIPWGTPRTTWVALDEWVRRPRMAVNFALVILDLVFYATAVDRLGFFITAVAFLSVLWLAFGVRRTWIAPLALAVTVAMHYGFYSLLRVPLPWGLLGRIAW